MYQEFKFLSEENISRIKFLVENDIAKMIIHPSKDITAQNLNGLFIAFNRVYKNNQEKNQNFKIVLDEKNNCIKFYGNIKNVFNMINDNEVLTANSCKEILEDKIVNQIFKLGENYLTNDSSSTSINTSESKSNTTNIFYSSNRSKKNQVKEQALESLEKIEYLKKIIFADPTAKEYVLKEPNLLNALRDMAIKESQNKLSK